MYNLFLLGILSFIWMPAAVQAVCVSAPDCVGLGYDATICAAGQGVLRCPFDTTKVRCISGGTCEAMGKKTCGEYCVPPSFVGCCENTDCGDGAYCDEAHKCQKLAQVGDVYYNDRTFSTELDSSKVPVGIVGRITDGGKHGVVIGMDEMLMLWGCEKKNTELPDKNSLALAQEDFQGQENTDVIVDSCGNDTAAYYCRKSYSPGCVLNWYLPSYGELYDIMVTNFTLINNAVKKVDASKSFISGRWYWTSTECGTNGATAIFSGRENWYCRSKSPPGTYFYCTYKF